MLAGKTAIITGATSGIGRATAQLFAREGARVCATGRNVVALEALRAEIGCEIVAADLTQDGEPQRVIEAAVAALGGLTTLVNCAGVLRGGAFGTDACTLENFLFNFNGNTRTVFEMMQHAIPHLKVAGEANPGGAAIINVSSVNGVQSFGGVANYCASKSAVDQLTRCAAVDLAPFGVRSNAINPGVVTTELQKRGGLNEEAYATFLARSIQVTHPLASSLGRVGLPEEVAELIVFLSSDKAKFITGDCVKIDGGRACMGAR